MSNTAETVQVAALVPAELADRLRELARRSERSQAAELRLAIRAWIAGADGQGTDAA